MSFNPNIPIVTDPILQSQRQIRANFQAMAAAWSVNHTQLTGNMDLQGMHNNFSLRPQTPDPATGATEVGLYNKIVSSIPQLFFRPNNSQTSIQMSYQNVKVDDSDTQFTFMAGPFIIYAGKIIQPVNGVLVVLSPGSSLIHIDLIATNIKIVPTIPPTAVATNLSGMSFNVQYQMIASGQPIPFDLFYFGVGLP
jgi:hypothetical protein